MAPSIPSPRGFALVGLLLACGAEPPPDAPRPAEPVAPQPAEATPPASSVEAPPEEPAKAPPEEPAKAGPEPTGSLQLVAVREGITSLLAHDDAPVLVLEGEPVPWTAGRFAPAPGGARGLPAGFEPMADFQGARAVGSEARAGRITWVTTETHYSRVSPQLEVYQRRGDVWQRVEIRKGPLVGYYAAYVERAGALLGLRQWSLDPSKELTIDEQEGAPEYAGLLRTLERAKPAWVHLAGPEAELPVIPADTALDQAVSLADGTIVALTPSEGPGPSPRLLQWSPTSVEAQTVTVPELDDAHALGLSTDGSWVIVYGTLEREDGSEAYLALGHEGRWERVPVSLPGRSADEPLGLVGAARTATGELWIALGIRGLLVGEAQPVWRRPVDGSWEPVPLPPLEAERLGAAKRWIYEDDTGRNDWVEHEQEPLGSEPPRATGLVAAAGAVWVALEQDNDTAFHGPISTVFGTVPEVGEPTLLPPVWRTTLERRNASAAELAPGSDACQGVTLVVGPASLATERAELVEALAAVEPDDGPPLGTIYTGELDGRELLVAHGTASTPAEAKALARAVGAVSGTEVALDCRVPLLGTVLHQP
ncbi:MAG: hypothetical protein KC501_32855 [Myxococcales bacterium]|nr:hypothetical protein [Myxococcales bacterium]